MVFPIASDFFAKCLSPCAGYSFFPVGCQSLTQLPFVDTKGAKKAEDGVQFGASCELSPKKIISAEAESFQRFQIQGFKQLAAEENAFLLDACIRESPADRCHSR